MQLYRLNVSRTDAGKEVPFDRIYMANGAARKHVKALFDYALVLPLTAEFRKYLLRVAPYMQRDFPCDHRATQPTTGPGDENWRGLLDSAQDWVLVVPILPKRARALMPSYLVNSRWYRMEATRRERRDVSPLPSLAFLQTPRENFRPVCVACPRFSEHQAGLCQLGQQVCFDTLVLGDVLPRPDDSMRDLRETNEGEIPCLTEP